MIPKIVHSRSQLHSHLNEYEDGAHTLFVSPDTYPELFDLLNPEISEKAPKNWRSGKMKYLWFPSDSLDEDDVKTIEDWVDRFERYVLIGLNRHIRDHFNNELDFCMALDYNFDPEAERRTYYGEAEYQLKYRDSRPHLKALRSGLEEAFDDLPVPQGPQASIVVTSVPTAPDDCSISRKLAITVAKAKQLTYIQANLFCDKTAMKELPIEQKIPEWEELYESDDCVRLQEDVAGKTIVIIDDLYQSGATMWCYAKYLKNQGAEYVLGLPCVKSLRDTDNQ